MQSNRSKTNRFVAVMALAFALVVGGGSALAQENGSGNGSNGSGNGSNGSGNGSNGSGNPTTTAAPTTAAPTTTIGNAGVGSLPLTGSEGLITLGAAGGLVGLAYAARRAALNS